MCSIPLTKQQIDDYINGLFASKPQYLDAARRKTAMITSATAGTAATAAAAADGVGGISEGLPDYIMMVGGPGSGKTSSRELIVRMVGKTADDFVFISADDILMTLFKNDPKCAIKTKPIIDRALEFGRKGKYNIMYDSIAQDPLWYMRIAESFKSENYVVSLCSIYNTRKIVEERMIEREKRTGQIKPPSDVITEKYDVVKYAMKRYLAQDRRDSVALAPELFDNFFVFDNTSDKLRLIFLRRHKTYECELEGAIRKLYPDIYCRVCTKARIPMEDTREPLQMEGGGKRKRKHRKVNSTQKRRKPLIQQTRKSRWGWKQWRINIW